MTTGSCTPRRRSCAAARRAARDHTLEPPTVSSRQQQVGSRGMWAARACRAHLVCKELRLVAEGRDACGLNLIGIGDLAEAVGREVLERGRAL